MKFKIDNIENLSDSRQVMESKPNKFIMIFIYILIAVIATFLTWAWFSEKEIIVKVQGIVRPDNEIHSISNILQGEVKSVKMKNGEDIKKGDILFEIDSSELQDKKNQINDQIDYLDKDNKNLKKLNKSINENTNYFKNNDEEKEYLIALYKKDKEAFREKTNYEEYLESLYIDTLISKGLTRCEIEELKKIDNDPEFLGGCYIRSLEYEKITLDLVIDEHNEFTAENYICVQ